MLLQAAGIFEWSRYNQLQNMNIIDNDSAGNTQTQDIADIHII